MANGYYTMVMPNNLLAPFFGLGLGYTRVQSNVLTEKLNFNYKDYSNAFSYQLMLGVAFTYSSHITLLLEYQYSRTFAVTFAKRELDTKEYKDVLETHTINLGIRLKLM